jgi:hypothetical protein
MRATAEDMARDLAAEYGGVLEKHDGWRAAIRRAIDAEDLLRRIVACGHCAHDVFAAQEEAKAYLMGRTPAGATHPPSPERPG